MKSKTIKRCITCGRFLSIDDFSWRNKKRNIKQHQCKKCSSRYDILRMEKEEHKEKRKQYYIDNKEKINKRNKQWYEDNIEHSNQTCKQWHKNNPEKSAMLGIKKKRIKKDQTPNLTKEEQLLIKKIYKKSQSLGHNYHVDHIIPLSKGGIHHPDNLQIIPSIENMKKGSKLNYIVDKKLIVDVIYYDI